MTATVLAPSGPPATPPGDDAPLGVVVVSYGSAELLRRNLAYRVAEGDFGAPAPHFAPGEGSY